MNLFGDPQELRHGEQFQEPNLDPEDRFFFKLYIILKVISMILMYTNPITAMGFSAIFAS